MENQTATRRVIDCVFHLLPAAVISVLEAPAASVAPWLSVQESLIPQRVEPLEVDLLKEPRPTRRTK